ncbi:S8 family peptidase [Actinomadura hibisca]|uniref:S8 family peptidase n=1 Tax=Actinomadura hibisca TaxID=68565 RepID=UPI001FE02329|nr:S8 family serine peptidase [Actinomadura hibisca]
MRTLRRAAAALLATGLATATISAPAAHADIVRDKQRPLLDLLEAEAAWKITRGAGVTVAVVDTGVDPRQPDLAGAVTTGPNMLADIDGSSPPRRLHGTSMASLIAGRGHGPGRRDGIVGLAPQARVLAVRAIAEPEDASYLRFRASERAESAVARGIRYAVDHGADVINLSLGKYQENAEERAAIGYAIGKGVVVVSAAGNDGDRKRRLDEDGFAPYSYPASYPGVIAVAATKPGHGRAAFSNRNYSVLVAAPGDGIPAAQPGRYVISSGTSDSSALVSGIAALIRAKYRRLPPPLVAQALINASRYGSTGGYDSGVGFGEVSAARALAAAAALTAPRPGGAEGKAAGQRFADPAPGPVPVIERPFWVRPVIAAVVGGGALGAVAALVIVIMLARRAPRASQAPR